MLYSQIICNDNVLSAVSFRINLWSAPATTPVPSDESFVFGKLVSVGFPTVLYWSCYLCRNLLVTLGCAPWLLPFPLSFIPVIAGPWRSLWPDNHYSTNNSCGRRPRRSGGPHRLGPPVCVSQKNLTTFIISNFFSHQPHFFFVTFLFDMFMCVGTLKRKLDQGNRCLWKRIFTAKTFHFV